MNKPKKTLVLRLDLSDWLKNYPWDFQVIGIDFHSCNSCNNIRIAFLGIGLMIGFADVNKLKKIN